MKKSLVKGVALVAASVLGITGLSLAPANATTRTVAVVQETNTLSGLNTAIPGKNLVTNVDVLYPTGAGFTYWNNKAQLVRNTAFGTFKITKNVANDFEVTYTIKKGLKWSDGTLITAQDLLLSHAISSSKYSVAAGLGDPLAGTNKFDSAGYGGPYDDHTNATSFDISDDNYSLTVRYDSFQPDWQIFGPGPTPVHALVELSKGLKTLQPARVNAVNKQVFENAYYDAIDSSSNLTATAAHGLADVDAIYLPTAKANLLEKGDKIFGTGLLRSGSVVADVEPSVDGAIVATSGTTAFTVADASNLYADMALYIPKTVSTAIVSEVTAGSSTVTAAKADGTAITSGIYVGDAVTATVLTGTSTDGVANTAAFSTTVAAVSGSTITLAKALPAGSTKAAQALTIKATYTINGTVTGVNYDTKTVSFTGGSFSSRTTWAKVAFNADAAETGLVTLEDPNTKAVSGNVTSKAVAQTVAQATMLQLAKKWSTVWNITKVSAATNPLLLISNGGFMIDTIDSSSATLKLNPLRDVSGSPKVTGNIQTLVFKFPASGATFNDVAAAQALANKEIDAYSGAANAAVWSTLKANTAATTIQASSATYEHLDLRTGTANTGANPDCAANYTGPFADSSNAVANQKAKDLRHAFLLIVPRQLIANTYVGKVFEPNTTANSPVLQSNLLLTTEGNYAKQVAGLKTYVDEFSKSQADRNAIALALVRKYYPTAGPNNQPIDIEYLRSTAARRADINLQIKLEAAKVGFNVSNVGNSGWPNYLDCNDYDVADFAWSRSSISQTGSNANYISTGGNNGYGWSDTAVDSAFNVFEGALSATELVTASINAEKALYSNYWSLPLYQWPGVASWNSDLKGVLYNPLNPNLVWNYWSWSY